MDEKPWPALPAETIPLKDRSPGACFRERRITHCHRHGEDCLWRTGIGGSSHYGPWTDGTLVVKDGGCPKCLKEKIQNAKIREAR